MSAGESAAGNVVHVVAGRFGGFAGGADVMTLGALRGIDARLRAELTAEVRRRGLPIGRTCPPAPPN